MKDNFFTHLKSENNGCTWEEIQSIKSHLRRMENFTYITKSKRDVYGSNHPTALPFKIKTAIKEEIEGIKDWLKMFDEDFIIKINMTHFEDELRLTLVKNFIYG